MSASASTWPTVTVKPHTSKIVVDGALHIGDRVLREVVNFKPPEVVALVWFSIYNLTGPLHSFKKKGDIFLVGHLMHYPYDRKVGRRNFNTRFFSRLTNHGGLELFSSVNVTRDQAVVAILVPRVESSQQEDSILLN